MEDPWANAWGEPSKSSLHEHSTPSIAGGASSWGAPSVSVIQGDHEDDLSTPAWSSKPTTSWGEPDIAETSLWGSDASAGWNPAPSTFDRISLTSKDSIPENEATSVEPTFQERQDFDVSSPSLSSVSDEEEPRPIITPPRAESREISPNPPSRSPVVPPLSLPPIDDIDGFGTFETVVEDSEEWGTPKKPTFSLPSADALAWGAEPWEAPKSGAEIADTTDDDDEWEKARQQKEKQDQHVPPELLATILLQFKELSVDLWPEGEPSSENQHDKERIVDVENLGLNAAMQRLVPEDLILPPIVSFPKTFTSKQLSEALKLTRHSHLTRSSPMALYMASKGSTSWEASIKAKPNIVQDDITPAGWKILESNKESSPASEDGKKKSSGGLLSFFGRRGTTSSDTVKRSASPVSNSAVSSVKTGASPRASIDSGRPSTSQSATAGRSTPSSPSVATFVSSANPTSELKAVPETYGNPSQDPMDAIIRDPTPPPPSAVTRFLGRFSSRTKASSKDSLALSSDDIEFLSDVPSFSSPEMDQTAPLDALSVMLKSPPLPTALPPPLAPPPKAPPKPPQMPPPPSRSTQNDDFMSFFDTLGDTAQGSSQPDSAFSLLTAVPTPPVKPILSQVPSSSTLPTLIPPSSIPTLTIGSPDRASDQAPRQIRSSEDQSWPSFDYPSAPMSKPPPPQNKRTFVPIMSSSRPPSTSPPLLPKPTSSFALPPPPSANNRATANFDLLSGTSSVVSPLPPPPGSRSHTPLRIPQLTQPSTQSISIDDDDDFSDFLSSPAQATNPGYRPFNDFAAPARDIDQPKPPISIGQPANSTSDAFGDFDDFLDPPPPQPPAKSTSFASKSTARTAISAKPPTGAAKSKESSNGLTRKVSKHDHSRTMSLLETAAARGRWLNPPSPLPEALQPPPSNSKSSNVDYFSSGGGGSMQTQQEQAAASLTASRSSPAAFSNSNGAANKPLPTWNFPPPPMNATPMQPSSPPSSSLGSAGYAVPKQQSMFPASQRQNGNGVAASNGNKSGGLSAQDLSFFEGL